MGLLTNVNGIPFPRRQKLQQCNPTDTYEGRQPARPLPLYFLPPEPVIAPHSEKRAYGLASVTQSATQMTVPAQILLKARRKL